MDEGKKVFKVIKVETKDIPSFNMKDIHPYTQDLFDEQILYMGLEGGVVKLSRSDLEMFLEESKYEIGTEDSIQVENDIAKILDDMDDKEYVLYVVE